MESVKFQEEKEKNLIFHYGVFIDTSRECVSVDWSSWDRGLEKESQRCVHMQIPYLRVKKELSLSYSAKLHFWMADPLAILHVHLLRWYLEGMKVNAFAFYRAFRQKVDSLGLESAISIEMLFQWLQEQNTIPLYNPQIALIDPQKRLNLVRRLLSEDFESIKMLAVSPIERAGSISSPLVSIDLKQYRNFFEPFVLKDLELYALIRSNSLKERGDLRKGLITAFK